MKTSSLSLNVLVTVVVLVLGLYCFSRDAYCDEKKIQLAKHPELKIGFSTQNFLRPLSVNVESIRTLVDFARNKGFVWIELRDPSAVLSVEECRKIAEYARNERIEMSYAIAVGLMDVNFWEVFSRGLANASVFDGPRTIRTVAAGNEFINDEKKRAWNLDEIYRMVKIANQAGNKARSSGLKYVAENSREVIKGDGIASFGITEFFANVNSNVGLQFDTGNPFCVSRVWTKPEDAQAFLEKYMSKLAYVHLKTSSKDHKPMPVLSENEWDFNSIFALMTKHKVPYVAIELDQAKTIEECYSNHQRSIEFLMEHY